MDSKVTSKTSSLKALLLKAWSERWTDLQWGIYIKAILPRGVSGDVYNLADIIFQQALVGPAPNQLILSYLKHSLSSQLVSYAAVVQRISKFDGFHKPHCVICLLTLLENIESGITCRTKQEESMLPGSILSLVIWLLNCFHYDLTHPCQFPELRKKTILLLNKIIQNPFTSALLYLAKYEKTNDSDVKSKCKEIEKVITEENVPIDNIGVDVSQLLNNLKKLDLSVLKKPSKKENFLDYSIQALLKVTALLNPTVDSQAVVNNLLIIQQLKDYKNARLYMEVIRASFINLNDSIQENCTAYWGAFTFIKLPDIIKLLACHYASKSKPEQASKEIVDGFLLLMEFCPLLNNIDTQTQNNNIESLLKEMHEMSVISEEDKNKILKIRKLNSIDTHMIAMLVPQVAVATASLPSVVSTAKAALKKMNKSLESDLQEQPLIGLLGMFLSINSYEIVSTFAAVKGELRPFVNKLIRYNETGKQINQNDGFSPYSKSLIFDLTFVILCSLVQDYGSEVVLPNKDGDSFFETWVRNCLKEYDVNKTMVSLRKGYDAAKIETLIEYFKSGQFDMTNPKMNWDEMCFAMPAVMKEIHGGWVNSGSASFSSTNEVKRMLDTISSQMCCLSICSVSWLCSYMQILQGEELLKARNMIQQFLTIMDRGVRNSAQNQSNQQDYYKERGILSGYILRKMQNYANLPTTFPPSPSIPLKDAVYKQLIPVWEVVLQKGRLTSEAAHLFKTVISVSDSRLFMKFMLHEILKLRFEDELNKAVDLLFALFYFNIHDFTVALLNHIPHLLFKPNKFELVEPQSTAIAKLTAFVICAAVQTEFNSQKKEENNKDTDFEQDLEEICPATKIMRMSGVQSGNPPLIYVSTGSGSNSQQQTIPDGPLLKALTVLFRAFDNVAERTGVVNSDTYFVFNVIKQIVDCGKETGKPILSHLSNSLIPNLMRSVPELFTMELILELYCLNSTTGTKTAVRDLCLLRNLTMKP